MLTEQSRQDAIEALREKGLVVEDGEDVFVEYFSEPLSDYLNLFPYEEEYVGQDVWIGAAGFCISEATVYGLIKESGELISLVIVDEDGTGERWEHTKKVWKKISLIVD